MMLHTKYQSSRSRPIGRSDKEIIFLYDMPILRSGAIFGAKGII